MVSFINVFQVDPASLTISIVSLIISIPSIIISVYTFFHAKNVEFSKLTDFRKNAESFISSHTRTMQMCRITTDELKNIVDLIASLRENYFFGVWKRIKTRQKVNFCASRL